MIILVSIEVLDTGDLFSYNYSLRTAKFLLSPSASSSIRNRLLVTTE